MNNLILKDIAKFGASFACGALITYFAPRTLLPAGMALEIYVVDEFLSENYENLSILAGFVMGATLLLLRPRHQQSFFISNVMDSC